MRRLLIAAILIATSAFAQQPYATPTLEWVDTPAGTSTQKQTEARMAAGGQAFATIAVSRPSDDNDARHCHVEYALLFREAGQPYKTVATFQEDGQDAFGVDVVGFSPDKQKVAANFWYAAGDFSAIRPAIYDRRTKKSMVKELGEQITSQLPACDYTMEMTGITNAGEAVVHIPKGIQVEEGCPDQGEWLFDLRTTKVRRLPKASPPSAR